ncbi:MAG TPA: sugar-binding protein [Chthoniobacteraceae bacterium]|nr:sugar-binding protein [Chthoniobacteraceae bacterium]
MTRFRVAHVRSLFCGLITTAWAVCAGLSSSMAGEGREATLAGIPAGAITVDGRFDEPFYAKAHWQTYPDAAQQQEAGGASTRFSLHLDDSHLYLSATVITSDGRAVAKLTERDGGLSKEDSVEWFLQCGADPSEGYQLIVNALGSVADYQLVQGGLLGAASYNADVGIAARPTQKGWQFEMAIPLAQLEIDPSRKSWGLQLATNQAPRDGKTVRFQSWSPVAHSLRSFQAFGTLALPDHADFSRFAWRVYPEAPVMVERGGRFFFQNRVEIENGTPQYRILDLGIQLPGIEAPAVRKVALAPGKRSRMSIEAPLGAVDRLSGQLIYRLAERAPGKGLLKQIAAPVELHYTPWELELIDPGYRQTIFATQKLTHLRARLVRTDPEADAAHLSGRLISDEGNELPATFTPAGENDWEVSVAGIENLADGRHRFSVTIGEGEERFSLEREMTKLPYQKGEVWIDALGIVRREGVAIPFYGYSFGNWTSLEKEWLPGFEPNLAGPVAAWGAGEKRFESQLKAISHLKSLGIYSILDVPTATAAWRDGGERRRTYPLSPLGESEKDEYRASIRRMKGNPGVIAYYLADEPELNQQNPRRLRQVADLYRQGDPYKPVVIVNNTYNGLIDYLETSDISMPDRYPVFRKNSGSSASIGAIELHLVAVPLGRSSYRARWATLQAFDYSMVNIPDARGPTAREMRAQQVSALIGGATGITWYPQKNVYDLPGVLSSLVYLEKEFRWVFETRQQVLPRAAAEHPGLQCAILEGAAGPMILVVNSEWKQVQARIGDPLLKTIARWKQVGSGNALATQEGALSFRLEAHEATILIPDSMEMPDLDWPAVEQAEARINAGAMVEGNVAHRSTGTVAVPFPEAATYPDVAMAVVDGMKSPRANGYAWRPFKGGEGVELRFTAPKRPRRVVIHGTNFTKGRIEIREGGEWKKVASFDRPLSDEPLEMTLPGEATRQLRFLGQEMAPHHALFSSQVKIAEIEVYE